MHSLTNVVQRNRRRSGQRRQLTWEQLEPREVLSGVSFVEMPPLDTRHALRNVTAMYVHDINRDSRPDILLADDHRLMWQENMGRNEFRVPQLLYQAEGRILQLAAGQLNGDTRPDIVLQRASENGSVLQLLKNDGSTERPAFSAVITIDHIATDLPGRITVADINADQHFDIALTFSDGNQRAVMNQYINIPHPSGADTEEFLRHRDARLRAVDQVLLVDADDDGDLDLISGVWNEGEIFISENTRQVDESGVWTGPTHHVGRIPGLNGLVTGDVNQDIKVDLVAATQEAFHLGIRREDPFQFASFIETPWPEADSGLVEVRDVNGDARGDIVYRFGTHQGVWHVLLSDVWVVTTHLPDLPSNQKITQFVDLDGDRKVEMLSVLAPIESGTDSVIVAQYLSPSRPWVTHTLPQAPGDAKLHTADVNSDGRLDIVMASASGLSWFPSIGGGRFESERVVFYNSASGVVIGDFDGDRDTDFMLSNTDDFGRSALIMLENVNQSATFVALEIMPTTIVPRRAGDLDGDGDVDALASDRGGIFRILNQGSLWPSVQRIPGRLSSYDAIALRDRDLDIVAVNRNGEIEVLTLADGYYHSTWVADTNYEWDFAEAADVDGDGDLDVVVASGYDQTVDWYETVPPEPGLVDTLGRIPAPRFSSRLIGDIDGDGDVDIVPGTRPGNAYWAMNMDGRGRFSDGVSFQIRLPLSAAADLSGDGRIDVLAMEGGQIVWFENRPATKGDFNGDKALDHSDIDALYRAARFAERPAPLFDLDNSGSVDHQDTLYWVTNIARTSRFDVNLDGRFDSGDLVSLFQHGRYEVRFATWYQGDFDGDGDFTTSDIILAFQSGEYENP